jgi:hypothetical protein
MRIKMIITLGFLLAACGNSYRYPCQDPAKAYTPECTCTPLTKNKALNAVQIPTTDVVRGDNC